MFEIVDRRDLTGTTYQLEIAHPQLALAAQPGQFVMVMSHERGERIPLTIADFDRERGTITLVIQAVGKTTWQMRESCRPGSHLYSLVGPMGHPSEIGAEVKRVVCVGGGLGVAPVFPALRAFSERGAEVCGVVGFRTASQAFWRTRFGHYASELVICTDDGTAGRRGPVTVGLEHFIKQHGDRSVEGGGIDEVIAIGPPAMMRACAELTRPHGIKTTVSLNPIMVDGTGMCGGCRVRVGGQIRFGCVDGPDFDGHEVDFDDLINRLGRFREDEQQAHARYRDHKQGCNLERQADAIEEVTG